MSIATFNDACVSVLGICSSRIMSLCDNVFMSTDSACTTLSLDIELTASLGGGLQPKKTERYRKFQIWDWFFSVFFRFFFFCFFRVFSVFPFWPILTGLTASC